MGEFDWKQYAHLCEDASASAIGRFAQTLRKASWVATNQSIPVYTGTMKGCLITVLRQMTDILKQLSKTQLPEEVYNRIPWKSVEDRMREKFFQRLCGIGNMQIAEEYVNTRLKNLPQDHSGVYQWVYSLQNDGEEIDRIILALTKEAAAFAREDVPGIMEIAQLGMRLGR